MVGGSRDDDGDTGRDNVKGQIKALEDKVGMMMRWLLDGPDCRYWGGR